MALDDRDDSECFREVGKLENVVEDGGIDSDDADVIGEELELKLGMLAAEVLDDDEDKSELCLVVFSCSNGIDSDRVVLLLSPPSFTVGLPVTCEMDGCLYNLTPVGELGKEDLDVDFVGVARGTGGGANGLSLDADKVFN